MIADPSVLSETSILWSDLEWCRIMGIKVGFLRTLGVCELFIIITSVFHIIYHLLLTNPISYRSNTFDNITDPNCNKSSYENWSSGKQKTIVNCQEQAE